MRVGTGAGNHAEECPSDGERELLDEGRVSINKRTRIAVNERATSNQGSPSPTTRGRGGPSLRRVGTVLGVAAPWSDAGMHRNVSTCGADWPDQFACGALGDGGEAGRLALWHCPGHS